MFSSIRKVGAIWIGDSSVPEEYIKSVTEGTLADWMTDIATRTKYEYNIYGRAPAKDKLADDSELSVVDGDMFNDFAEIAAKQILIAGLRMAKVINEIFGE